MLIALGICDLYVYGHPQTLSLWSVHLANKGNLLLPKHVVIKGKDFVVVA